MRFPKNKSRVEEVIERRWDLSSHEICHLYVAPDFHKLPPILLTQSHILLPLHGNRQHRGDHLLKFSFRGKEKTTNSCPTGPPAKFQLKLGI